MLGQVHVHGRLGVHQVVVGHGRRHDGAVVLVLAGAQQQPLALGLLGHRPPAPRCPCRPGPAQRRPAADRWPPARAGRPSARLAGVGRAIRPCRRQRQHNQVGPGGFRRAGPSARVVHASPQRFIQQGRPVVRLAVAHLDGHHRRVRASAPWGSKCRNGRSLSPPTVTVLARVPAWAASAPRVTSRTLPAHLSCRVLNWKWHAHPPKYVNGMVGRTQPPWRL